MAPEPSVLSYLDAIVAALRSAGKQVEATRSWLSSAEDADTDAWRLTALAAARSAHAEALARVDEAAAQLGDLGAAAELPAPLHVLPGRIEAMRAELRDAEARIAELTVTVAARPIGEG